MASRLATFDRANMRLTDTDNAIIDSMAPVIIHALLLTVQLTDNQKIAILDRLRLKKPNC